MKRQRRHTVVSETAVTIAQIRARVNRFLLSEAGSRFCAGEPKFEVMSEVWRVPILFITPGLVVGHAGEAIINHHTLEINEHTAIEHLHAAAGTLRKRRHAAIKAAFIQASI
jgi:hypothetical protein